MRMISKYNGTCRTCSGPIVQGSVIEWSRAEGARHIGAAACVAATEFKALATANPVVQTVARVDGGSVTGFLQMAQGRGLKAPKVRFLAPGGGELRLALAAGNTRYPGAVQVKVDGVWVGRIGADGVLTPGLANNPAMVDTLTAIANSPADAAKAYGKLMGRCSFCAAKLTDDRTGSSVEVGYGPVCAARYGLPHHPTGKAGVLKEVPVAVGTVNVAAVQGRLTALVAQMGAAA